MQSIKRVHAVQRFPLFRAGFKRVPCPESPCGNTGTFPLILCTFLLMVTSPLADPRRTHTLGFRARRGVFATALPTCFVEGISVGVAGRLLGRFCGVHAGIRFNTIQRQKTQMFKKKKKIKSSAPENPPFFIPHMFSVPLPIPPSASMCFFL